MLRDVLSIGDKIDMKQLDRMGRPLMRVNTYVSQLADIVDHNVIHIAAPIRIGIMMIPEVGESYSLCFYTKAGLFQCSCNILSSIKENNTTIIEVKITSDLEKFQRRQYYRVECIHEITYHLISREEEILLNNILKDDFENSQKRDECKKKLNELEQTWTKAAVSDISGGGVRFNSEKMHKPGEKIRVKLEFVVSGKLKMLNLGADIISSNRIMNRFGFYENRAEFTDIGRADREDLIKFIFEQDRKLRKNTHT